MNKYIIFGLLFILGLQLTVFQAKAQSTFKPVQDPTTLKKKLQAESQNTSSIACDFVQERHLLMMTQPIVSNGKFWFKKPASIRWEYVEPYYYLIILTKRKVFVKEDNSKQEYDMSSGNAFQSLGEVMFSFILGDIDAAEKDYKIEYMESNQLYYIKMIPKVHQQNKPVRIDMYFEKKDYTLHEIKIFDSETEYTGIKFLNKTINGQISNEKFKFK